MRIAIWLGLFLFGLTTIAIPTAMLGKLLLTLGVITWLIICIVSAVSLYWWFYMKLVENDLD